MILGSLSCLQTPLTSHRKWCVDRAPWLTNPWEMNLLVGCGAVLQTLSKSSGRAAHTGAQARTLEHSSCLHCHTEGKGTTVVSLRSCSLSHFWMLPSLLGGDGPHSHSSFLLLPLLPLPSGLFVPPSPPPTLQQWKMKLIYTETNLHKHLILSWKWDSLIPGKGIPGTGRFQQAGRKMLW